MTTSDEALIIIEKTLQNEAFENNERMPSTLIQYIVVMHGYRAGALEDLQSLRDDLSQYVNDPLLRIDVDGDNVFVEWGGFGRPDARPYYGRLWIAKRSMGVTIDGRAILENEHNREQLRKSVEAQRARSKMLAASAAGIRQIVADCASAAINALAGWLGALDSLNLAHSDKERLAAAFDLPCVPNQNKPIE